MVQQAIDLRSQKLNELLEIDDAIASANDVRMRSELKLKRDAIAFEIERCEYEIRAEHMRRKISWSAA
ncbi:hypothetical protein BMI91_19485 [Thioclava sediminum]|uniref:DUF465 domain-containing protein n=1 Tax=Thioclava sediminum TaxID=1915319 RepID=A0ABX3MRY4_9RHOB|nr:hypothetical protein [Thioclava sediminum]OOY22466.1 hypothetical protein BMI91_19485 [Thioclava sediminum]